HKKVLLLAFLILIVSLGLMPLSNRFIILISLMFCMNLGLGTIEISVNSLGAKIFIKNTALMMNLLHLFYGLGATIGPRYAGLMLSKNFSWQYIYFYSLLLAAIIFIFIFLLKFPESKSEKESKKIPINSIISDKKIWLFSAVL